MISIRMPKDIRDYKEKIVFGLTIRQLICGIMALGIVIPLYLWGASFIPEELLSWIVILTAAPCVAIGFVKIHNMPFERYIVDFFMRLFVIPVKRSFKSENAFREWQEEADREDEKLYVKMNSKQKADISFEIAAYIERAEKSGENINADELKNKIMLANRKEKKSKSKSKNNTEKEKKDPSFEKLKRKAEAVRAKQENHPYYVFNKNERKILSQYERKKLLKQREAIKKEKIIMSRKNSKMQKRRRAATVIPKSTQQTIPFIADYEEGLFEVEPGKFNKMYKLLDLNYSVARESEQEAIFVKYRDFLNYFSSEMNISVTIDNHIVSKHEQEQKVLYKLKDDDFDKHREEYNRILRRQIVAGKNDMVQNKYITVGIECETPIVSVGAILLLFNTVKLLQTVFRKIDEEILDNLKKIGTRG